MGGDEDAVRVHHDILRVYRVLSTMLIILCVVGNPYIAIASESERRDDDTSYGEYVMSQFRGIREEVQTSSDKKRLYYDQYLASFPFEGSARAFYGIGVLDAGAAESVNLREFGDDTSPSWGEYYTGTKAVCVSDPDETWVSVWIGNETGVIHRNNLCFDTDKAASHPFRYGEVLNDTLLSADSFSDTTPTFAGEEHLKKGQMIILLGRTSNGHYLADSGKGWGYVRCDSVKTVNELSQN